MLFTDANDYGDKYFAVDVGTGQQLIAGVVDTGEQPTMGNTPNI
jgi:hypothetical protein